MARDRKQMKAYRGRLTLNDTLKIITAVLIVLVLVLGSVYWYTGGDMISFDIMESMPDMPWDNQEPAVPPEPPLPITPDPVPTPVPIPEPQPKPELDPILAAVQLPLSAVVDGTASAQAQSMGANAIILDMKTDAGVLGWYSEIPMAGASGAVQQTSEINQQIEILNEGDLYMVARVSLFKDHAVAGQGNYPIRTNSGYRWTDSEGMRWTSPTNVEVQNYVLDCLEELCQLGFDEIVLDNAGYPNRGNLGYIKKSNQYNIDIRPVVMAEFYEKLDETLQMYDTKISIRVPNTVLTGEDTRTGLSSAILETYAHRIWLDTSDVEIQLELMKGLGITGDTDRVVIISDGLTQDITMAQGVINQISF